MSDEVTFDRVFTHDDAQSLLTKQTDIKNSIDALTTAVGNINNTAVYDGSGNVITATYAPLSSPTLTGNPTAPTQTATDDSTKIATTAFVHDNTDDKAPLASPALTGNPTAPTQATTDNSTKIANTAYVKGNLASYAPLANPALTGSPTAPTQGATDNSTKIATTAFVKSNVPASVGSATKFVYTDSNGKIVASNSTVGGSDTPVYLNGGTITAAAKYIPVQSNAGYHNSIYRGKSLGASVTSAQWTSIKAGTFDDLFIGDYWTINSVNWRIAAFDYLVNCGDTNTTAHHVFIVPDSNLASCKMNDTNITTGAYIGSDYYTGNNSNTGKATAQTAINNAFGAAHILSHRELLANAVNSSGQASGWAWYDSTFELMNEAMVYGHGAWGSHHGYETGIDKGQLPLFALEPSRITNRAFWWLRSVVSATAFADVTLGGSANYDSASYSLGVRPAFAIYQS